MPDQPPILIREPRPGDGEGLAPIWIDAGTYYAQLDPDLFQVPAADGLAASLETWVLSAAPEEAFVRVAAHNDQVVGVIYAVLQPPHPKAPYQLTRDLACPCLMINALLVRQAYWRQSIGTQLMAAAEAWGRSQGAVIALLDTYGESPVSLPFYERRMGYRRRNVRLRKPLG